MSNNGVKNPWLLIVRPGIFSVIINNMKSTQKILAFIVSLVSAQAAGLIGSVFTVGSIANWYPTLIKPSWTPPAWVFGPVWLTLYTLMAIAAYLIWEKKKKAHADLALKVYAMHLAINALWSIVFFGLHDVAMALIIIIVLWFLILGLMILFYPIRRAAAWLLLPYIIWVSLAISLNIGILALNYAKT